jgi:hypothetical protein
MDKFVIVGVAAALAALVSCASPGGARDAADSASPAQGAHEQHRWLARFVGEWDWTARADIGGGQRYEYSGVDRFRAVGEYWVVGEGVSEPGGVPFRSVLTLGFDPDSQRFIGTWIDSTSAYLWRYDGELDPGGNTVTLTAEGPSPTDPGARAQFREVIVFESPDHRVNTGSVLGADGRWTEFLTVEARRRQ